MAYAALINSLSLLNPPLAYYVRKPKERSAAVPGIPYGGLENN